MKSKNLNAKYFLSHLYPKKSSFSINWGNKIDIDMAVDTLFSAPEANVSLPHVQTKESSMSMSHG